MSKQQARVSSTLVNEMKTGEGAALSAERVKPTWSEGLREDRTYWLGRRRDALLPEK